MKILGVKFLNLNSLTGSHEIRFDVAPINESGLFAITGPTGSGKTTILDAITLALYAKVHRHDKEEETMSRHTGESFAEVEFEVNNKAYRSKWSRKRSRLNANGNLQPEKMELSEVETGLFIGGHTPTSTKNKIVELCGLDYNQFLRSVILCQGDFTKFLKSSESERSELLEKITDTIIYADLSRYVYNRQKTERELLDSLIDKLDDTTILTDDELQSHKVHLNELDKSEKAEKKAQSAIRAQLDWLVSLEKLRLAVEDRRRQLSAAQDRYSENTNEFERLNQHDLAVTFRPQLVEMDTVGQQLEDIDARLTELILALPAFESASKEALSQLNNAAEILQVSESTYQVQFPLFEKVMHLDTAIQHSKSQVDQLQVMFDDAALKVSKLVDDKEAARAGAEQAQAKSERLINWLAEHDQDKNLEPTIALIKQHRLQLRNLEQQTNLTLTQKNEVQKTLLSTENEVYENSLRIGVLNDRLNEKADLIVKITRSVEDALGGKTIDQITKELVNLPAEVKTYEQLYAISLRYDKALNEKASLASVVAKLEKEIGTQNTAFNDITEQQKSAVEHLNDLNALVILQQRIVNYEKDRGELIAGDPCPLCGSLDHPYAAEQPGRELNATEQKFNEQDQLVKRLSAKSHEQSLLINGLNTTLNEKRNQYEILDVTLSDLKNEFGQVSGNKGDFTIISSSSINEAMTSKNQVLRALIKQMDHVQKLSKDLQIARDEWASEGQDLKAAQNNTSVIAERVKAAIEKVNDLEMAIDSQQITRDETIKAIKALLEPLGISLEDAQYDQLLINRAAAYVSSLREKQSCEVTLSGLLAEIQNIDKTLIIRKKELDSAMIKLQAEKSHWSNQRKERQDLFGERNPVMERNSLQDLIDRQRKQKDLMQENYQTKKQQFEQTADRITQETQRQLSVSTQFVALRRKLSQALIKKEIADVETLRSLFMIEEFAAEIRNLKKELESTITSLQESIDRGENEIKTENAKQLTTESIEVLNEAIGVSDSLLAQLNQEIGKLKQILADDIVTRQKYAAITIQIEKQTKEFARWSSLNNLIGSADGRKFSRFAQGLTLTRLTDLANLHLQKLTSRYTIRKSELADLELLIVDGYQADVERPMNSLSGGESFLVSLALALGLSDLASHKVQINSLFIDEGFGTLDPETLDIAIGALESLQAKGKSIGVISHVEALKERIGTQIRVSPQPGGVSRISIIGYGQQPVLV
ncbi:hypothetical protein G7092_06630 [Mucilaginibacter sp. HC2]|uniref:AAA family ATPase n=1 Tax=Mucilaginibacter inviolabilis TaxID=2714892 RepID=UPI0014093D4C|nr:SbcC/MukB-like Walker B domain-containing protein [Mucilaginibacter inviolabilis]NHA03459.1 hypothetical protein [Mucilaginibacter inviolabilis]